jgi:desulfoferrodoxin-like iron-binding protein
MVNVQKAGEVYMCNVCGHVSVKEFGGGNLVCHDEMMQPVIVGRAKPTMGMNTGIFNTVPR